MDKTRAVRVVVQDGADLRDRNVQGTIEIHGGVAPDFAADAVAVDHVTGVSGQKSQDLEGLWREMNQTSVAPQLAGRWVELECAEPQRGWSCCHDIALDRGLALAAVDKIGLRQKSCLCGCAITVSSQIIA